MHNLFVILFIAVIIPLSASAAPLEPAPEPGHPAPLFELKDAKGTSVRLADQKGKVVLLNFWSVRCVPCAAEMPSLERLFRAFRKDGLMVLAITVDRSGKLVNDFVKENSLTFPVLLDPEKEVAFDDYAAADLPVTFLIDKTGLIVEVFRGQKDWDSVDIKRKIQGLLAK
jgi:peroxiredoxin